MHKNENGTIVYPITDIYKALGLTHVTDCRLCACHGDVFNPEKIDACNPEGFKIETNLQVEGTLMRQPIEQLEAWLEKSMRASDKFIKRMTYGHEDYEGLHPQEVANMIQREKACKEMAALTLTKLRKVNR
jgi:hypothetical protein